MQYFKVLCHTEPEKKSHLGLEDYVVIHVFLCITRAHINDPRRSRLSCH